MNAPVVLFVYNRVEHTKQVLEALDRNEGVSSTKLYIFSDAEPNEVEEENVKAVREYLEVFQNNNNFEKVEVIKAKINKGLERSIINGVTDIINRYGKVIVLEDDILTSPDFLIFMNQALEKYEKDDRVWSVSGYTIGSSKINKGKRDVYFTYRGECWGWASWCDRWNKVDWSVSDYDEFKNDKKKQRLFNRSGRDMTSLLEMQQMGEIKSWAIRWCYQQFKEQMITIFPKYTKVANIGFDGSGTNCSNDGNKNVNFKEENSWNFEYDMNDTLLLREFQKDYWMKYWRQKLGKYWYLLTEYEYCLVYNSVHANGNSRKRILKPNFREWYADPIPFFWNEKQFVFVEIFDKFKEKGCIGVCDYTSDGILHRPHRIIEENFHMSFPNVFTYKKTNYLIPECSETNQIRIYKMGQDITQWECAHVFENMGTIVDIAIWMENELIMLLGSRINPENRHQSRLVLYRLEKLGTQSVRINKEWEEEEYSYDTRNGGNFIKRNEECIRVVQHSTKNIYGKFITLKQVEKLDSKGINEKYIQKMDIINQKIPLPQFLYRMWGIHTYGISENIEIIDVLCQRFSLGGIFVKVYRRIKGK